MLPYPRNTIIICDKLHVCCYIPHMAKHEWYAILVMRITCILWSIRWILWFIISSRDWNSIPLFLKGEISHAWAFVTCSSTHVRALYGVQQYYIDESLPWVVACEKESRKVVGAAQRISGTESPSHSKALCIRTTRRWS